MKFSGVLNLGSSSKYITTGVAALGVLAFAAQADAADIYAPGGPVGFKDVPMMAPVLSWSGFYAGAHVGGAWANLSTTDLNDYWFHDAYIQNIIASNPSLDTNPYLLGRLHTDLNASGVFGGGTVGYNMQRGSSRVRYRG